MREQRYFILTITVLFLIGLLSCRQVLKPICLVLNEDKAEIIRLILEPVINQTIYMDYQVVRNGKKVLLLSTENLEKELLPNFPEVEMVLLTPEEIQRKAEIAGRFYYLKFGPFEVLSADSIRTSFYVSMGLSKKDRKTVAVLGGGIIERLYIKEDGKWKSQIGLLIQP